jgi:hypothetical protein
VLMSSVSADWVSGRRRPCDRAAHYHRSIGNVVGTRFDGARRILSYDRNALWGPAMPAYRIYWLDRDNHVTEADSLIAEADDDARDGKASYLGMASFSPIIA